MDIFAPLQSFANTITYQWFGLSDYSYVGAALNFFVYDIIKISILLVVINQFMAIVRSWLPVEKVREVLVKRRWFGFDYLLAALLGVVTPFCSCSSIPLFIGFLSAGIPLGITITFLISSPLVNESSLYLFPAIFGWKVTLFYNVIGIGVAVLGGILVQKLRMEHFIHSAFLTRHPISKNVTEYYGKKLSLPALWRYWSLEAWGITAKVWPYVVLGVGIGALLHGFVPQTLITTYLSSHSWWTVPMAVLIGIPLYANSVSVIPIAEALVNKGMPIGTALAFMTATVTLSIPEALMLSRVMKRPLLATFFGITTIGIVLMGYVFNALL